MIGYRVLGTWSNIFLLQTLHFPPGTDEVHMHWNQYCIQKHCWWNQGTHNQPTMFFAKQIDFQHFSPLASLAVSIKENIPCFLARTCFHFTWWHFALPFMTGHILRTNNDIMWITFRLFYLITTWFPSIVLFFSRCIFSVVLKKADKYFSASVLQTNEMSLCQGKHLMKVNICSNLLHKDSCAKRN